MLAGERFVFGEVRRPQAEKCQFEERDLVAEHGATYQNYRRRVPMIVLVIGAETSEETMTI